MDSIDFLQRTRLIFGQNSVDRLGELAAELGATRVLVVSDPGVVSAGHFQHGVNSLTQAGLRVSSFHGVHENPTTDDVDAGVQVAQAERPDLLVAIGGGSSMDCAKGINFLYSCGGRMEDYWGVGKATADMLPLIAVPTTSGTGSEAQSFALISQVESHVKMACGDPRAACRIALLDPTLTLTQPSRVTALTGIDAISHAIETQVTIKRSPLSNCYSRKAWQLLSLGFPRVLSHPHDIDARGQVQLGAYFSGLAIETSMLGAAHALANPLTARFDITHGQAVGAMLPAVIRFNSTEVAELYAELWREMTTTPWAQQFGGLPGAESASESLALFVQHLVALAGLETELGALNIPLDSLEQLAEDACAQWTGTFNPRKLSQQDFLQLYRESFSHS
ncbi:MAG: iron-containing alcohol dehydrogenase [Pirellulaceae bacterium]|nr:iron-containing alcohol dehydrogenase [Pirellulaceae bacterium]